MKIFNSFTGNAAGTAVNGGNAAKNTTEQLAGIHDQLISLKDYTICREISESKKGTNFSLAPAYSPELSKSSNMLHLVLRDSFLRQPIRFEETFQQPMRFKQSVGILAITGSKNKYTIHWIREG